MFRTPHRPQRSPEDPQAAGRHPSPNAGWGFPGPRHPYSGHHERSPRGDPQFPARAQPYPPGSGRGYRNGSPGAFGSGPWGFRESPAGFRGRPRSYGDSPAGFRGGHRGFGDSPGGSQEFGQKRGRGDGHWRPRAFNPSTPNYKAGCADVPVERYFSQSMLEDPWRNLQPITQAEASSKRAK